MKPKILAANKIHQKALKLAETFADVDVKTGLSEKELIDIIGEYDAIIIRSKPNVTGDIMKAGKKLKAIGRAGVGLDNVDLKTARELGIEVINSPEASTISVAEHAIGLMISLMRKIPQASQSLRNGNWDRKSFMGNELFGKKLGLLGFGRIGREVALRARAFGMDILVSDPIHTSEDAREYHAKLVEPDYLFSEADIISLHVPAIESTHNIINRRRLSLMKPDAVIVNTSRGHAVDEEVLFEFLKKKKIGGAALDVYKNEPPGDMPIFGLDNVVCVPHLGASTEEAQINAGTVVVEKIKKVLC